MVDVYDFRFRYDFRIEIADMVTSGNSLRHTFGRIALSEHSLSLEIRRLDKITIDDPQSPDAGTGQSLGMRGPQRAAAND